MCVEHVSPCSTHSENLVHAQSLVLTSNLQDKFVEGGRAMLYVGGVVRPGRGLPEQFLPGQLKIAGRATHDGTVVQIARGRHRDRQIERDIQTDILMNRGKYRPRAHISHHIYIYTYIIYHHIYHTTHMLNRHIDRQMGRERERERQTLDLVNESREGEREGDV